MFKIRARLNVHRSNGTETPTSGRKSWPKHMAHTDKTFSIIKRDNQLLNSIFEKPKQFSITMIIRQYKYADSEKLEFSRLPPTFIKH